MQKKYFILVSFLFTSLTEFAQEPPPNNKQILARTSCDCKDAIPIAISKSVKYGPTNPPEGGGMVKEFAAKDKTDKFVFKQEHNSAWYFLNIQRDGELAIDIVPEDSTNDYDFLLYKYTDSSFCNALSNNKIKPIRGNLSQNNLMTSGLTGLSSSAKTNFTSKDDKRAYSKSLEVKKGERYMLVLDNISLQHKGYTLYFSYMNRLNISGVVTKDSLKQPLASEIILMDERMNIVAKTISNKLTGAFSFSDSVKENCYYSLIFYSPMYFPESAYINTALLKSGETDFIINKELRELKTNEEYSLNYYTKGEQAFDLYSQWPPIYSLSVLMNKNPKIKIQLEVHADEDEIKDWEKYDWSDLNIGITWNEMEAHDKTGIKTIRDKPSIMEWRARNLIIDLRSKGDFIKRVKIVSVNNQIIPHPKTDEEQKQNRQLLVKVLSIK